MRRMRSVGVRTRPARAVRGVGAGAHGSSARPETAGFRLRIRVGALAIEREGRHRAGSGTTQSWAAVSFRFMRRAVLAAAVLAILGIAVAPAVSYSTAARAMKKDTGAEKLRKALKACKKDTSKRKRKACEHRARVIPAHHPAPTNPPETSEEQEKRLRESLEGRERERLLRESPEIRERERREREEVLPGTLIVHVIGNGGPPPGGPHSLENQPLRVWKLGPFGEITGEIINVAEAAGHTVTVSPGEYMIEVLGEKGGVALNEMRATVTPGQEVEVTIDISIP